MKTNSVYPRWRGEHFINDSARRRVTGLSPLARGTRHRFISGASSSRFIPAGAGNTYCALLLDFYYSVYPRWRGEHLPTCCKYRISAGLSPLARGTRHSLVRERGSCRFIPAGAGNTCLDELSVYVLAVYPRWRGEHHHFKYGAHRNTGLSPLARGTLAQMLQRHTPQRFIPAGAGNTITGGF